MQKQDVTSILSLWPDRRALLADARAEDPVLELVAVHRWFQRGSVPARFWAALVEGAHRRGFRLTSDQVVAAHSQRLPEAGLTVSEAQGNEVTHG